MAYMPGVVRAHRRLTIARRIYSADVSYAERELGTP